MQYQFVSFQIACDLIEELNAEEIHSAGWSQTFKAEKDGSPIYIQLPGTDDCLLIN
ncbi:hypothetical protein D9M70_377730 [compost metagenome]